MIMENLINTSDVSIHIKSTETDDTEDNLQNLNNVEQRCSNNLNSSEESKIIVDNADVATESVNNIKSKEGKINKLNTYNNTNTIILLDDDEVEKKSGETITVIDLDDYEDETDKRKRKKTSNSCINFECESGENLRNATIFCLNYYRVKVKRNKKQEVCAVCYETSLRYYENLSSALKNGNYLIEQEFPVRDDFVEIDSDEEITSIDVESIRDAEILKDAQEFLNNALPETINDVLHKYHIEEQASYACNYLEEKQKLLAESLKELEDIHKELQLDVDQMRTKLYTSFQQEIKQLPSIEIVDRLTSLSPQKSVGINNSNTNKMIAVQQNKQAQLQNSQLLSINIAQNNNTNNNLPNKRDPERRSNRNITKPASYCELNDDNVDSPPASVTVLGTVAASLTEPLETRTTNVGHNSSSIEDALPPRGQLIRTKPIIGETYYAMRQSVFGAWGKVRLMEMTQPVDCNPLNIIYKVKFESKIKGTSGTKNVNGRELAYSIPANVRLEVGTRVIAVFLDETTIKKESYFTGVIAEPLTSLNQYRYLVFFDDGYAQYVKHEKVLVVVECSKNVWDDVHPESQHFIRKYLEEYPDRPMVKLQPGQVVKTEWNGKWWIARVVKVDGSLVHMYFDADARSEWIYRGSTRLGPLFLEMQAAANRLERGPHIPKMQQNARKNLPYVEYTRSQPDSDQQIITDTDGITSHVPRAVAKKSTNRPANIPITYPVRYNAPQPIPVSQNTNMVPFLPSQHQVQQPQSKVVYFTPKSVVAPKFYEPHTCSSTCKDHITLPLNALKGYNPLSKPLLCGWHRISLRYKGKKTIIYKTPCGKCIRDMHELHRYLRQTKSDLSVDMFDFDFWVHCLAEFVLDKTYRSKRDISNGVENVPIPCVNYVDNTMPDFCNYSTQREPMEGVNLNLDTEFLCGCDCEDDCSDRTKCACWQLTINEARTLNKRVPDELIGYTYKRLPEFVTTGIYECNSKCKCAATCLNRVVQHPLQLKLQLFKTANRGWGIRCLNDIPQGAFICIYAGSLLTDKMANEGGVNYGDEYLAELDYIEVVERQKEGYESDVSDIEEDEDEEEHDENLKNKRKMGEYDEDFHVSSISNTHIESPIRTRARKRTAAESEEQNQQLQRQQQQKQNDKDKTVTDEDTVTISDDDENVREPSRFAPTTGTNMDDNVAPLKFKSVRKYFGEDEVCYIMDAKNTGNIGRFLNHSCSPNVFVQNVFVDTHDLRFPWVAFFAMNYIRAGTELTWNYNYDVGSVPGKVIFCHCGSPECRGRLL